MMFFPDIETPTLKSKQTLREPQRAETILKKIKVGGHTVLDFKTYYKATTIEQSVTSMKTEARPTRRTRDPRSKAPTYSQMTFDKAASTIRQGRNSSLILGMVLGKLDIHNQKNEFGPLSKARCKQ